MKLKNQTVKKSYTIIIYNDEGYEVDRRMVSAENAREAVRLAFKNIFQ